jgi:hypothetical protein
VGDVRSEVLERLAALAERVGVATGVRKGADPAPDDPMRGLYLTEAHIGRLLDDAMPLAFPVAPFPPLREGELTALGRRAGLDQVDLDVLVVAVAPDLDPRFEKLYGYLHDDITRRRASVGLALRLAGRDLADADERARLAPEGALVRHGLVSVDDSDRPFLTRALRVPDRVVGALLGDERIDSLLVGISVPPVTIESSLTEGLVRALEGGARLVYLSERSGGTGRHAAAAALAAVGKRAVCLDLSLHPAGADPIPVVQAGHREALLQDAGLVAGPIDDLAEREVAALRVLATPGIPVVLTGQRRWDPQWSATVPLVLEPPALVLAERAGLWRRELNGASEEGVDPGTATSAFRLGPDHILRAAESARLRAMYDGRRVGKKDLLAGARSQNSVGLQRLARRIEPNAGWSDLILPEEPAGLLRELTARVRFRERVLDQWGMRRGGGRSEGVTALFAGPSGTGKTLAAEVIGNDLGLDLYTVDLATVVDKYIGETEKNLDKIFNEAERVNGVLFFDEADALFGKRSEVKDARDRYANVEVAYLLQRMERFDGLAVLATNLRANLDDAFARRIDVMVDFPAPDEEFRLKLWAHCFSTDAPMAADVDLFFCAKAFELAGGNIRNIAVTSAYLAASDDTEIKMLHVIRGVQREYRKLGRLCLEAEFGRYYSLIGVG